MLGENTLLKTACHFLVLLVGFDTLTYRKNYNRSPILVGHQKACHLPLELEHKAYWAIKELNYFKLAGEKRLFDISSLDEWRTQAYENAKLFKEKVKRWHDKRI